MAAPADKTPASVDGSGTLETELYNVRNELNNVILALRQLTAKIDVDTARFAALTAKLDLDAGITDANYASTIGVWGTDYAADITETTGTTPPAKVVVGG